MLARCILAAPAAFCTSFEMHGLTLFGSQMLFFSISHAFPAISLVVLASAFFFVLLALLNVACLIFRRLSGSFTVPPSTVGIVLFFQGAHVLALFSYEVWSSNSFVRVTLGLVSLILLAFTVWRAVA